jgi:ABC-type Mn2+/Zn2+ transport system ATPase subunit
MTGTTSCNVWLRPGVVERDGGFSMQYILANDGATALCRIPASGVAFSTIRSPSGSGKSTLIERLVTSLRDSTSYGKDSMSFNARTSSGEEASLDIAVIPQTPPFVKHWQLGALLPSNSAFALAAFGDHWESIKNRQVGQLSGGQQRRIYACSAIETLTSRNGHAAVLVLDETLDGLNPSGAGEFVTRISEAWAKKNSRALYLLIVSHLPTIETEVPENVRASLMIVKEIPQSVTVEVTI